MKVYILMKSEGEYEDYDKWVDSVYLNKNKASEAMEVYNKHLKQTQEQLALCFECDYTKPLCDKADYCGRYCESREQFEWSYDAHYAWIIEKETVG